jgi:hypothetical protein
MTTEELQQLDRLVVQLRPVSAERLSRVLRYVRWLQLETVPHQLPESIDSRQVAGLPREERRAWPWVL